MGHAADPFKYGAVESFFSCFRQPTVVEVRLQPQCSLTGSCSARLLRWSLQSNDQDNTVIWQKSTETTCSTKAAASTTESGIVSCTALAKTVKQPFRPVAEAELHLSLAPVVTVSPRLVYPIINAMHGSGKQVLLPWMLVCALACMVLRNADELHMAMQDCSETPDTPSNKGSSSSISSTNYSPVSDRISLTCTETTVDSDCAAVDSLSDIPLLACVVLLMSDIHTVQSAAGLAAVLTYGLLSFIKPACLSPCGTELVHLLSPWRTGLKNMAIWSRAAAVVLPSVNAKTRSYIAANNDQLTMHIDFDFIGTFFLSNCA